MFWPEADDDAARGALRRTLSALRSAWDGPGLLIERTRVALDPAGVSVDLAELERLAARTGGPTSRLLRPWLAARSWPDSHFATARLSTIGRRLAASASNGRSAACSTGWRAFGPRLATAPGRSKPPGVGWSSIRSTSQASDGSSSFSPRPTIGPAPSASTARSSRCSTASWVSRPCARRPICTSRSARRRPLRRRHVPVASIVVAPAIDAGMRPTARPLPFVGRDRELAEILATARDASPDGRLILVEGEAGIGKTRLAEVATDRHPRPRRPRPRVACLPGRGRHRIRADRRPAAGRARDARRGGTPDRAGSGRARRGGTPRRPPDVAARGRPAGDGGR